MRVAPVFSFSISALRRLRYTSAPSVPVGPRVRGSGLTEGVMYLPTGSGFGTSWAGRKQVRRRGAARAREVHGPGSIAVPDGPGQRRTSVAPSAAQGPMPPRPSSNSRS